MSRPSLKTADELVAFQTMLTKLNKIQKARNCPYYNQYRCKNKEKNIMLVANQHMFRVTISKFPDCFTFIYIGITTWADNTLLYFQLF